MLVVLTISPNTVCNKVQSDKVCVHLCVHTLFRTKMKGTLNQWMHLPTVCITNNAISEPGVFSAKVLQDEWLYHCHTHTLTWRGREVLCHIAGWCVNSTSHTDLITIPVFCCCFLLSLPCVTLPDFLLICQLDFVIQVHEVLYES